MIWAEIGKESGSGNEISEIGRVREIFLEIDTAIETETERGIEIATGTEIEIEIEIVTGIVIEIEKEIEKENGREKEKEKGREVASILKHRIQLVDLGCR